MNPVRLKGDLVGVALICNSVPVPQWVGADPENILSGGLY